jgi:hypothetical protein
MASMLRSTSSSVVAHEHTLMRIAVCCCHTVTPHQQVPSLCSTSMTRLVRAASPNVTSTWFNTTSLRTVQPPAASASAKRRAWRQHLSTRSATPLLPSVASAAQISMPRARRESSGV